MNFYTDVWLKLPGNRINVRRRYEVLETLHESERSTVTRVLRLDRRCERIVKLYRGGPTFARRELAFLRSVRHPGIVTLHDFGWTNRGDFVLELELIAGQTFAAWCGNGLFGKCREDLSVGWQVYMQVVEIVAYLHWAGWLHGDLRPENVLVADRDRSCKLIDFEFASRVQEPVKILHRHSLDYAAADEQHAMASSVERECYSLALMGLELLKCVELRSCENDPYWNHRKVLETALDANATNRHQDTSQLMRALKSPTGAAVNPH